MLTKKQLHIVCHSLGLDDKGKGKSYRNYFAAGNGTDLPICQELVKLNIMQEINVPIYPGKTFIVTRAAQILLPLLLTDSITAFNIEFKDN